MPYPRSRTTRAVADMLSRTYTDLDEIKDTMSDKGQNKDSRAVKASKNTADISDFVLDKSIFSSVFEKDIRRVYFYKKAERLAKAIYLVGPAFKDAPALRDRLDRVALGLVDAAAASPAVSREALSRELLVLSSILGIARTGGMLSAMNADLIAREAHQLLSEIVSYEEPRLALEEVPTLAVLAKAAAGAFGGDAREAARLRSLARVTYDPLLEEAVSDTPVPGHKGHSKGQVKDTNTSAAKAAPAGNAERRESIMAVLRAKGASYIKDISLVVRDVSEKTIQRELSQMVAEGLVVRKGDRRWTTYELA